MIRKSVIRTISMILILLGSSTCVAIAGSIDTNSPELLDIKLSTNEISAPGEIEVEVIARDDISGLERGWLHFENIETGKTVSAEIFADIIRNEDTGEYDPILEGSFKGVINIDKYALPGEYELSSGWWSDVAGNSQNYSKELHINKKITVYNNLIDSKPPELFDIRLSTNEISAPGEIEVEVIAKDDISGLDSGWLHFENIKTGKMVSAEIFADCIKNEDTGEYDPILEGSFKGVINIDKYALPGEYELSSGWWSDLAGNSQDYSKELHINKTITVHNNLIDSKPPELFDIKLSTNEISAPGEIEVEVIAKDDISGLERGWLHFKNIKTGKMVSAEIFADVIKNEDTGEYDPILEGSFKGVINIDKYTFPGEYELSSGWWSDLAGNSQEYSKESHINKIITVINGDFNNDSSDGANNSNSSNKTNMPQSLTSEERIYSLSKKDKEIIINKLNEEMPYTSREKGLTLEILKNFTDNKFTDKQLEEIIDNPEILNKLGIELITFSKFVGMEEVQYVDFKDIDEKHWANDTIKRGVELGIIAGMPDGSFAPNKSLQIADTFTFLDRLLLLNDITEMNLTRSVVEKYVTNKEHWAFANIASISSKLSEDTLKIISNMGEKPIKRELLAQVIYEIIGDKIEPITAEVTFNDIENSEYKEAIHYCVRAGLLSGVDSKHIAPEKVLTRAELISVLIRLNDLLE